MVLHRRGELTTPFNRTAFSNLLHSGCILSAKQLLQQSLADGSILLPCGESADTAWWTLPWHIDGATELDLPEENRLLHARYCHLWKSEAVKPPFSQGFPLAFTLELLDRVIQGEHPLFCEWAIEEILNLLPVDPRHGATPSDSARNWQPVHQDDSLPFLVPDTSEPAPMVLEDWQVAYPHGVI